jgi:hypothetical protein
MVEAQHLSRAARLLRSTDSVAPPSAGLSERLQVKFPRARSALSDLTPPPADAPMCTLEAEAFVQSVKRSINGASGGRSALTGDHVRPLLDNSDAMRELQRVVTLLINGRFPGWAHPYFFSMRLIALGVKERPVCIGEWITRLASAIVNRSVSAKDAEDYFLHVGEDGDMVFSLGSSIEGGAEGVVHIVDSLVHDFAHTRAIISSDGKNAYNSFDRVVGCNITTRTFPPGHFHPHTGGYIGPMAPLPHSFTAVMS